jgi:hypothetical protein
MKLYELSRGEIFSLKEQPQLPPDVYNHITLDQYFILNSIDGMYSHCIDTNGNVHHFAAWTEVEVA